MSRLIDDLKAAEANSSLRRSCLACDAIRETENAEESLALSIALSSSTIGAERLTAILAENGITVSVRQVYKHRREGHK